MCYTPINAGPTTYMVIAQGLFLTFGHFNKVAYPLFIYTLVYVLFFNFFEQGAF